MNALKMGCMAAGIACSLLACKNSASHQQDAGDTLAYKTNELQAANGPDSNSTMRLQWITALGKQPLADSVNKNIVALAFEGAQTANGFRDSFFARRNEILRQHGPQPTGWSRNVQMQLINNTPSLTTLQIERSAFDGGVYPSTERLIINFSGNGNRLGHNDFFNPGQDVFLEKMNTALFKQALVRKQVLPDTAASLQNAGVILDHERLPVPANYTLMPGKGLLLHYNAGEVAPRVLGDFTYMIPLAKLKGMLNDKWYLYASENGIHN